MTRSRKSRRERRLPREPRRRRIIPFALAAAAVLTAVVVAAVLLLRAGESGQSGSASRTAVIVDQLQLTKPNPQFVSAARERLARAGYAVDYVKGEEVTVDFYRRLPRLGYDLVILRVHAGITTEVDAESGQKEEKEYVSLFTGEEYSETKYPIEQLDRLGKARYYEGADPLFGIGPQFVEKSMEGEFQGAVIVMMGCDGLRSRTTGQAFLDRGASAFVSWSKPVSAPHTDDTTLRLLERLLIDGLPVAQAVQKTSEEMGPDPQYEGELRLLTPG